MAQYTSEKNHTYRSLVMDNADIVSFGTVSGTSGTTQTSGASVFNGQFVSGNTLAYYVLPCSMKFYGAAIYCNVTSGTHKVTGMNVVVGTGDYVAAAQTQDNVDVSGFPPTYAPTGSALFMGTGTSGPQDLLTTGSPVASGIYYSPAGPTSGTVVTINQLAVGGVNSILFPTTNQDVVYQRGTVLTLRVGTSGTGGSGVWAVQLLGKTYDTTPYLPSEANRPMIFSDIG